MALTEETKGVFAILPTPFGDDDGLDLGAIGPMIDFYRRAGCDGITMLGVMGEAPKLSTRETKELVSEVLRHSGGMTVLAGISASGLAQVCELSAELMDLGVAGVMVNASHTIKTDADCWHYFSNIAKGLGDIPFVLQDFPLATGIQIPVEILERVVREYSNCKMIKQEDWPGWHKIDHLRQRTAAGELRRVSILSGFGALYLPEDLMRGSDGAMTGFSYPEMLRGVVDAHGAGEIERLYDIFDAFLPVVRLEMSLSKGLAVRKYILKRRGVLPTDKIRFPGAQLSDKDIAQIDLMVDRMERRLDSIGFSILPPPAPVPVMS